MLPDVIYYRSDLVYIRIHKTAFLSCILWVFHRHWIELLNLTNILHHSSSTNSTIKQRFEHSIKPQITRYCNKEKKTIYIYIYISWLNRELYDNKYTQFQLNGIHSEVALLSNKHRFKHTFRKYELQNARKHIHTKQNKLVQIEWLI